MYSVTHWPYDTGSVKRDRLTSANDRLVRVQSNEHSHGSAARPHAISPYNAINSYCLKAGSSRIIHGGNNYL